MCYKCNADITDEGYDHFSSQSCALFDKEEVEAWERENGAGAFMMRGAGGEFQVGGTFTIKLCPVCRQRNLKEGKNNHIRCWSCQRHFCAHCDSVVRSAREHFRPGVKGGCKQHS